MDNKLFAESLTSVVEMDQILRGKKQGSRRPTVCKRKVADVRKRISLTGR